MGTNRIRKKQGFEKFDIKTFCAKAEDIYVQAHRALEQRDKTAMYKYITEYAFAVRFLDWNSWKFEENGAKLKKFG